MGKVREKTLLKDRELAAKWKNLWKVRVWVTRY